MALFQTTDEEIKFWSIFLDKYRESVYLWSTDKKLFKDRNIYRTERQKSFLKLIQFCRQRFPAADFDFVSQKIRSFTSLFRKNYKKVLKCRNEGVTFNPSLWYYKKLLFLVGHQTEDDSLSALQCKKRKLNSTDNHDSNTSDFTPNILQDSDCVDFKIINAANEAEENENIDYLIVEDFKNDADEELQSTSSTNNVPRISLSRQYNNQYCTTTTNNNVNSSGGGCGGGHNIYHSVAATTNKTTPITNENNDEECIDDMTRTVIRQFENMSKEDICDAAGTKFAHDLREMSKSQRLLTEKILAEVIYYGKRHKLRSSFIFQPFSSNFPSPTEQTKND